MSGGAATAAGRHAGEGGEAVPRTCAACRRGFIGKAGRMLGDRPVCPACAPNLRPPVACVACGRATRRPGHPPWSDGPVCERCQRLGTHATCYVCRRHRRIAATGDDGRPVCVGCAAEVPAAHPCPDCRGTVPGRGAAPCRTCALRRRVERRVAFHTTLLEQPWVRSLFGSFCAWDGLSRTAGAMTRRIDAYAACFATIDRHCPDPAGLDQELLLCLFRAEGLRRLHIVVRFLVGHLALDWDLGRAEAFIEAGRIEALLAAADKRWWGPTLRDYRDHLARDSNLQPKTVRFYLNAGAGLLAQAGHADLALLQQSDVDRYLRRKQGQRASLTRFLAHAELAAGVKLAVPLRRRRGNPKTRERALLREVRALLDRLDRARDAAEGRSVLAVAISKIYAVPLSAVLALKVSDVDGEGAAVTLWPEGLAVELAPVLTRGLRRWASWDGGYLFPGRNRVQALSHAAVRHHVPGRMNSGGLRHGVGTATPTSRGAGRGRPALA